MFLFDVYEAMKKAIDFWDKNRSPLEDLLKLLNDPMFLEYEREDREPDEGIPAPPGRRIRSIPGRIDPARHWLRWYPSGFT